MKVIVFEGLDGVGKSTLIQNIKERLEKEGKSVRTFSLPVNREVFNFINKEEDLRDNTRLSLMIGATMADYDMYIRNLVENKACDYILIDRFFFSSYVYQTSNNNNQFVVNYVYNHTKGIIDIAGIPKFSLVHLELDFEQRGENLSNRKESDDETLNDFDMWSLLNDESLRWKYQEYIKLWLKDNPETDYHHILKIPLTERCDYLFNQTHLFK